MKTYKACMRETERSLHKGLRITAIQVTYTCKECEAPLVHLSGKPVSLEGCEGIGWMCNLCFGRKKAQYVVVGE